MYLSSESGAYGGDPDMLDLDFEDVARLSTLNGHRARRRVHLFGDRIKQVVVGLDLFVEAIDRLDGERLPVRSGVDWLHLRREFVYASLVVGNNMA